MLETHGKGERTVEGGGRMTRRVKDEELFKQLMLFGLKALKSFLDMASHACGNLIVLLENYEPEEEHQTYQRFAFQFFYLINKINYIKNI